MTGVQQDAYIDAVSGMVGLTIAETWRPGVRRFLGIAAGMASVLETVPLADDDLALAPVYRLPPADRRPEVTHDR